LGILIEIASNFYFSLGICFSKFYIVDHSFVIS